MPVISAVFLFSVMIGNARHTIQRRPPFPQGGTFRLFCSSGPVGRSERIDAARAAHRAAATENGDFKSPLLEVKSTNASRRVFRRGGNHRRFFVWRATRFFRLQ